MVAPYRVSDCAVISCPRAFPRAKAFSVGNPWRLIQHKRREAGVGLPVPVAAVARGLAEEPGSQER